MPDPIRFRVTCSLGVCLAVLVLATCATQSVLGETSVETNHTAPTAHNATSGELSRNQSTTTKSKPPFWRYAHWKNVVYEHRKLDKLNYVFNSVVYEKPLVAGEMANLSFKHLGPILHNETSQGSWIAVLFHVPSWPLTSLMLPRVRYVAQKFPNMTFLSVDCTDVSSYTLLSWDLTALPSLVLFNTRYNLAQRAGTATTSSLVKFIQQMTELNPVEIEQQIDFDDVSLRSDDLPRMDSFLVEILFLISWISYVLLPRE